MTILSGELDRQYMVADYCPHHESDSRFECIWRGWLEPHWQEVAISQKRTWQHAYLELRALRCLFCSEIVVATYSYPEVDGTTLAAIAEMLGGRGVPTASKMIYPNVSTPKLPSEVPRVVASLWEEAALCASVGALRGAAGCLRGAVELIAKDQGITSGRIIEKIDALGQQLGLAQDLIDALHDTRLTGNWSLHDGVEFTRDEIDDLSGLVMEVVEIVYVQPARRAAMAANRAARRGGQTPPAS